MNRRYVRLLVLAVSVALVFTAVLPAGAANPTPTPRPPPKAPVMVPPTTVTFAEFVGTIVGEKTPGLAAISPDGTKIIYALDLGRKGRQMCVFTLADKQKKCYQIPDVFKGYPYQLMWSPDSSMVAFSENPIQQANESDIWTFKVADGTFTDLTNDNVEGAYRGKNVEGKTFWLDYLPMWNQADGMIYFWRIVPTGQYTGTVQLYRMTNAGANLELVRDLTKAFASLLIVFDSEHIYLDGVSTLTADGSKVAVALQNPMAPVSGPNSGVWMVDLKDKNAEPKQLVTTKALQAGLPSWWTGPLNPDGLAWATDNNGLVILTYSQGVQIPLVVVYYVDLASGKVTPYFDFSKGTDSSDAFLTQPYPPTGWPYRTYSPWTGSMSPYGNNLLLLQDLNMNYGIAGVPLPMDFSKSGVIYLAPTVNVPYVVSLSSRSKDGKVLMYDMLFQLAAK